MNNYEWQALKGYIEGIREYHKQHEQFEKMNTCDDILEQMECIERNNRGVNVNEFSIL
jgi:hypothetical protein